MAERAFPRGGKKASIDSSLYAPSYKKSKGKDGRKNKKINLMLEEERDIKVAKAGKGNKSTKSSQKGFYLDALHSKYLDDLKCDVLREDMLVLGCIHDITDRTIHITLPGRNQGIVALSNVSQQYIDLIKSSTGDVPSLKQMFTKHQFLPVRVLSPSDQAKFIFNVTIDPCKINSHINSKSVTQGMVLSGVVVSKEDHGYIIDLGIQRVHAFLKFEKVEGELLVGQVLLLAVESQNKEPSGYNAVKLSALSQDVAKAALPTNHTHRLIEFTPGLQFSVKVVRNVKNGVEVKYSKDESSPPGYIYVDHLKSLFPSSKDNTAGAKLTVVLLYVKPLVNVPFFKVPVTVASDMYQYGSLVNGVIEGERSGGVLVKIGRKPSVARCFVPTSKLPQAAKILNGSMKMFELYPKGLQIPRVRVGVFDAMARCYRGDCQDATLNEKTFSVVDLAPGQVVDCIVCTIESHFAKVKIGQVKAHVRAIHIPPGQKLKIGQKLKGRVLSTDVASRNVDVTLKPDLIRSSDPILTSYQDASPGDCYLGTVAKVFDHSMLVVFYNGVTGMVRKRFTTCDKETTLDQVCNEGQIVKCYVVSVDEEHKMTLSLIPPGETVLLRPGKLYKVTVVGKDDTGLHLEVKYGPKKTKRCTAFLPRLLLTDHAQLSTEVMKNCSVNQEFRAYCVYVSAMPGVPTVFGLAATLTDFYKRHNKKTLSKTVMVGAVVPFFLERIDAKSNSLKLGHVTGGLESVSFDVPASLVHKGAQVTKLGLTRYQLLMGKVRSLTWDQAEVSIKLSDCWDKRIESSLQLFHSFLMESRNINKRSSLGSVKLGQEVSGVVTGAAPHGSKGFQSLIRLSDHVEAATDAVLNTKAIVKGKVVYLDAVHQLAHILVNDNHAADVATNQELKVAADSGFIRARVVYTGPDATVVALKGAGHGRLAFMPNSRHINDLLKIPDAYTVGEVIQVGVFSFKPNMILALDRQVILLKKKQQEGMDKQEEREKNGRKLKRKLSKNSDEGEAKKVVMEQDEDNNELEILNMHLVGGSPIKVEKLWKEEMESEEPPVEPVPEPVDIKSEVESEGEDSVEELNGERIDISSSSEEESDVETEQPAKTVEDAGFKWEVLENKELLTGTSLLQDEVSSDDEDTEETSKDKKKKQRLTGAERREKARLEEERLRNLEEELMNPDRPPQCANDFDRLVLSRPDDSVAWLQYMSFHLQSTDIERARGVARRALKTISFTKEQEKLNVWLALINLENLYGSEESLKGTVQEALQCNDAFAVESHLLAAHGLGHRLAEMERLGNAMLRKYKDSNPEVWWHVGGVFLKSGRAEAARAVLQRALTSLDKAKHVEVISKFAQLENKHGNSERAQTLYENILSAFPKRVDVWSVYVDMLVKSDHVDLARQVLERATSQHLPAKKMKTLFKKFVAFEEAHGDEENLERVKQAALDYVNSMDDM